VSAGVQARGVGGEHDDYQSAIDRFGRTVKCFCIVRDPLSWYQSYWADRMLLGWGGDLEIGRECASERFEDFVRACVSKFPGFVTKLYGRFTACGDYTKIECCDEALLRWLIKVGENPNAALLRHTHRENRCASLPVLAEQCRYSEALEHLVREVEHDAFKVYGY
jgi:hypothetical protein